MKHNLKIILLAIACALLFCTCAMAEESYENCTLTFSLPSGFYPEEQELTITCDADDYLIYYTTDGSIPTEDSQILYFFIS